VKKPNILVIWGDDIGYWNVSAYNQGMMGYKTPNIDRIAKEGCAVHRLVRPAKLHCRTRRFITGQWASAPACSRSVCRARRKALKARDVTIAELLKAQGYMTGQFGKNHLGDLDEHLPTAHGFDEFKGSLYHLNAEDEPEHEDYFKTPLMRKNFGTRGVIHTWANPTAHRKSKAPARSTRNAWRPSTRKSPRRRSASWPNRRRPTSPSSSGGTRPACTSGPG
jgi:arylsulfatase A-like enzyme